jgi:hypothetical protein
MLQMAGWLYQTKNILLQMQRSVFQIQSARQPPPQRGAGDIAPQSTAARSGCEIAAVSLPYSFNGTWIFHLRLRFGFCFRVTKLTSRNVFPHPVWNLHTGTAR